MAQFAYPDAFATEVRAVFAFMPQRQDVARILQSLKDNDFGLGPLLFSFWEAMVIDMATIEETLSQGVTVFGSLESVLLDADVERIRQCSLAQRKCRDDLRIKKEVDRLYKEWKAIYDRQGHAMSYRIPKKPCIVVSHTQ